MEGRALEVVTPGDRGEGGSVELVRWRRPPRRTSPSSACRRPRGGRAPTTGEASSKRASVTSQAKRMHSTRPERLAHVSQVGQQVGLGREARRPVVGLREREAVELVGHVDPAAGVDVLEPGATDVVVLLEDSDLDAGLAKPVGRGEARGAGPDHGTAERAVRFPAGATTAGSGRCRPTPAPRSRNGLPVLGRRRRRPGTRSRRVPRRQVGSCRARARARSRRGVGNQASAARRRASSSCSGVRPRPGTSIWDWSGANSGRSTERSPGPVRHRAQERMHVGHGEGGGHPRPLGNGRAARAHPR